MDPEKLEEMLQMLHSLPEADKQLVLQYIEQLKKKNTQ